MNDGTYGWWEPIAALLVIVLPLLLAWWLVVRGVRRTARPKRVAGDNRPGPRTPP